MYKPAREELADVDSRCLGVADRMILQFLVPVKLLLGVMPSPQLIEAYALHEYTGLTDAIRCGNLRLFNEYLEKYQEQFIQQGVYLLIEKLRLVVLRNLLKKVYVVASCLKADAGGSYLRHRLLFALVV